MPRAVPVVPDVYCDHRQPIPVGSRRRDDADQRVVGRQQVRRVPRQLSQSAVGGDEHRLAVDDRRRRQHETRLAAGGDDLRPRERAAGGGGYERRVDGHDTCQQAAEEGGDELRVRRVDEHGPAPGEARQMRRDRPGLAVELAEGERRVDGLAVRQEREGHGVRTSRSVLGDDLRECQPPPRVVEPDALGQGVRHVGDESRPRIRESEQAGAATPLKGRTAPPSTHAPRPLNARAAPSQRSHRDALVCAPQGR